MLITSVAEWIRCLTWEDDSTAEAPRMFRGLALPVGLRRNQSAALEFSRDNSRLIGVSEGRSVIWLFRRPHEAPRLLPSAPAANRLATDALALPLGLGARIDPDG